MALFHKTLTDIRKLVKQGKYDKARRVLNEHIKAEHQFHSDLSRLQGSISAYQHQLRNMQGWWQLSDNASKNTRKALADFERMILEAENQLKSVEAIISKLKKEVKIKLK